MKAIICDKCKKIITEEKEIKDLIRLDLCTNFVGKYSEKHLCDKCKVKFNSWLNREEIDESNQNHN